MIFACSAASAQEVGPCVLIGIQEGSESTSRFLDICGGLIKSEWETIHHGDNALGLCTIFRLCMGKRCICCQEFRSP